MDYLVKTYRGENGYLITATSIFILHITTCQFFPAHSIFMGVWGILGLQFWLDTTGIPVIQKLVGIVTSAVDSVVNNATRRVTVGIKDISTTLTEAGQSLATGITLPGLISEFSNHKVGIGLCVKSAVEAESFMQVAGEIGKISSMCGLETSLISGVVGNLMTGASNVLDNAAPVIMTQNADFEKVIPLLATGAALLDYELSDINVTAHMNKVSLNLKNAEIITKHVRNSLEVAGVLKPANWAILSELNTEINELKSDFDWCGLTLVTHGAQFTLPTNYERVCQFKKKLDAISAKVRAINLPEIKNNQIVTEINQIIVKSRDILNQIELIRKTNGIRPKPVGVCFVGPSQLGKSTLVPEIINVIKSKLQGHRNLVGNVNNWTQCNLNQRDEYDTGYNGDEIVYTDDAFQDKEHKDHLMWYQYISTNCVGTVQAQVEQKGTPFRALLCMTSANQIPKTSTKVTFINALWERFPLTFYVSRKSPNPKIYDPTFSHLSFKHQRMVDNGSPIESREYTVDEMAEMICTQIIDNMQFFNAMMDSLNHAVPLNQNADTETHNDLPDWFNNRIGAGEASDSNSDISLSDIEEREDELELERDSEVELTTQDEELSGQEEIEEIEVNVPSRQIQPVVLTTGEFLRIPGAIRQVAEDIDRVLNAEYDTDDISAVGSWTNYIVRRDIHGNWTRRFDPNDYDDLFSFISTMGVWRVEDDNYNRFVVALARQPSLRISFMEQTYVWGAAFGGFRQIVLLTPQLRRKFEIALLAPWRQRLHQWKDKIAWWLLDPRGQRESSVYLSMNIINSFTIFPPVAVVMATLRWNSWLNNRIFPRIWRPDWASRPQTTREWLGNSYLVFNSPIFVCHSAFSYCKQVGDRLSRGMLNVLLTSLESLGINVSEFWGSVANLATEVVSEVITVGIASAIVYLIYRLAQCLFGKKEKKLQQNHTVNETDLRKQARADKKSLKVRKIQLHQDILDTSVTTIKQEGIEWTRLDLSGLEDSMYYDWVVENSTEETSIHNFFEGKQTNILVSSEDSEEDLLLQKTNFISAKRIKPSGSTTFAIEIRFDICENGNSALEVYDDFISAFKKFKIIDWEAKIISRRIDETIHSKVCLVGLKTSIQGTPRGFHLKDLKDLTSIALELKGEKMKSDTSVSELIQNSLEDSVTLVETVRNNHTVKMSFVPPERLSSLNNGISVFGIGHKNIIICNGHAFEKDALVRFNRYKDKDSFENWHLCRIKSIDMHRDLAIAEVLTKREAMIKFPQYNFENMHSIQDRFRDLSINLAPTKVWEKLVDKAPTLCFLPKSGLIATGRVSRPTSNAYIIDGKVHNVDYIEVADLKNDAPLCRKGDCGGVVVSNCDRYQTKILGFHSGNTTSTWCCTILVQEDIKDITLNAGCEDSWERMIVPGKPTDLPKGEECTFIGKYISSTKPCGEQSLQHWRYSSWSEQFEERLQPGPLDPYDTRIEEEIPLNGNGRKSLLLKPNSAMCQKIPEMKQEILDVIVDQLTSEYALKIGHINKTSDNIEEMIDIGINGHSTNEFCKGMVLEKSCGAPWNAVPGVTKKSDMLEWQDEKIVFKGSIGAKLKERVSMKLKRAREGDRIISFSNSKLKDAQISVSAVKKGKTRVFHCIPVDKVITDASLFGNFKEAFTKSFLKLNHAIGVNPNSRAWREVKEHILKQPNVFDLDFSNFDKYLHANLLRAVFDIIRGVINKNAPDDWDEARKVLAEESIRTFVIDYDTIYQTERGNKSGEYLTTIVNCVANEILSYYTWILVTNNDDLSVYRKNSSLVTYGDDKIQSVSDEYKEIFNYFTMKEVMTSIGHTITPGSKDGIEVAYGGIDKIQFLKRSFTLLDGEVVAPLIQTSIEGPFVWTRIEETEHDIWENLIEAQILEAVLHGKEYYDNFIEKLSKGTNSVLTELIAPKLAAPYSAAKRRFFEMYHNV